MRHVIFALAALLLWSPANASERDDIKQAYARLAPSVAALYSLSDGGNISFLCSATAVDREGDSLVLLTAYHCVKRGVSYLVNFGDNQFHPVRVWQLPSYEVNAVKHPRAYGQPQADMALFLMDNGGDDKPLIPMAESSIVETGSSLAMVGLPLGLAKISYEGSVAGYFDRPGSDEDGYVLLQIFGAPGSSGSAVLDIASGEIIGVLVQARGRTGLPVIFATPIDYIKYLIPVPTGQEAGEDEPEGEVDPGFPEQDK